VIDELKETLKVKQQKIKQLQVVKQQTETNIAQLKGQIEKSKQQANQRTRTLRDCNDQIKTEIGEKTSSMAKSKQQEKMLEEERKIESEIEEVRNNRKAFESRLESHYARATKAVNQINTVVSQHLS